MREVSLEGFWAVFDTNFIDLSTKKAIVKTTKLSSVRKHIRYYTTIKCKYSLINVTSVLNPEVAPRKLVFLSRSRLLFRK